MGEGRMHKTLIVFDSCNYRTSSNECFAKKKKIFGACSPFWYAQALRPYECAQGKFTLIARNEVLEVECGLSTAVNLNTTRELSKQTQATTVGKYQARSSGR